MTDFILIIIFPVLLYFYVKTLMRIKAQDKEINYLYKYRDTLLKKVAKYNLPEDLYTKEQVDELLKRQREICAEKLIYFYNGKGEIWNNEQNIIRNAPSPLEGEKK